MKSAIEIRKKKQTNKKKQEFVLVRTVTRRTYAFRKRLTSKFFVFYLFFVVILSSLLFCISYRCDVWEGNFSGICFPALYENFFLCSNLFQCRMDCAPDSLTL